MLELLLVPASTSGINHPDTLFTTVASTGVGNPIALEFLDTRWDAIKAKYEFW